MTTAIEQLQALHQHDRRHADELVRCDREEPAIRAELQQARLTLDRNTSSGFFTPDSPVAERFRNAETALRKLEQDRETAVSERARIASEIREIVRGGVGPAWEKLVKTRQAEIDAGLELGASLDKVVAKFHKAHAKRVDAENAIQAYKNSIGLQIFLRLQSELEAESPLPRVEDTTANRQNYKRAVRLHKLACGDLTQTPILE